MNAKIVGSRKTAALIATIVLLLGIATCLVVNFGGTGGGNAEKGTDSSRSEARIASSKSEAKPVLPDAGEEILRLLIWEGHAPQQYVEEFEKRTEAKYGRKVKLEITYLSGPDDWYDRIKSKNADMVMMGHNFFKDERFNYIQNQLLLPLDLENIPNHKNVTLVLQDAEYLYSDEKVYASPVSQGPYGLAYNSALVESEPQSWKILWDPRYQDKYVIGAHEYIYNANITALALGYAEDSIGSYDAMNNKEFKERLRQLAVNAHSFWIGVDKPEDLTGMTLATSWGDSMAPLNARGEPWKMAEPTEGMPCWIDNYAITSALKDKPFLKKVAEEYINGLLSTDYQIEHIMRNMSLTPIITNIDDLLTAEEKQRIHIGTPNFFDENRILQHTYSQRDRNGLKLMWEEAMRGIPHEKQGQ